MKTLLFASTALLLSAAPVSALADDWKVDGGLAASVGATDNVLASAGNELSDTVYGASADLSLTNEGEGGSFTLWGSADLTHYADADDEDADDYAIGAKGKIKFDGGDVFAGASHSLDTEDRRSVVARRDTRKRTEWATDSFDAGFKVTLGGGVGFTARVDYDTHDFEDARHRITNAVVDQDFRDRGAWTETFRLTAAPDAGVSVFGQVSFTQVDYDLKPPAAIHNRDSEGYAASVGASFDITDQLTGEIGVGWAGRNFDGAGFDDVSDLVVDADLTWTVSDATTLKLAAARGYEESTTTFSPIYVATAVGAKITHNVTPAFQLAAYVEQAWADHKQRDRQDTTGSAGASLAWGFAENAELTAAYDFSTQDSEGAHAIPGYDDGRFTLGVKLSL